MKPFNHAEWIWLHDCQYPNTYVNFEETFTGGFGDWKLYIAADQAYAVYVNGIYIPGVSSE